MSHRRPRSGARVFEREARRLAGPLLLGDVLALDPASGRGDSTTGWAWFFRGELRESGVLPGVAPGTPWPATLRNLRWQLQETGHCWDPELLVIEELRGSMVNAGLHWASGVLVSEVRACEVLEVPLTSWKSHAKETDWYYKSDEHDAILIGWAAIQAARS